jgi:prepilin-type N-terminal cleavage/methylation domain-containing protein
VRRSSKEAGFTLHEVLVALAISAVISLVGWTFYRHQLRDLTRQSAGLDAFDKARAAMGFIARDIRAAGYDPMLTALIVPTFKGIREAGADRIHIEWDRDESGVLDTAATDPDAESVRYSYDSATRRILRTVNGVTTPLVENVPPGGFSLRYFNLLGNEITTTGLPPLVGSLSRDLIASVRLTLRVETNGVTPVSSYVLASRISVRARIVDRL